MWKVCGNQRFDSGPTVQFALLRMWREAGPTLCLRQGRLPISAAQPIGLAENPRCSAL
jgi:hypothetical protein